MKEKTKRNLLSLFFAFLIGFTLIMASIGIYGAALGAGFFALIIWNNKFRKTNDDNDKSELK